MTVHLRALTFAGALVLGVASVSAATFHASSLGTLNVGPTVDYYSGSNGSLFAAVNLPTGATALQFIVTGSMFTDGSANLASPDGLYSNGSAPYNFSATSFSGTYNGTPLGSSTGTDPALFGVFFNPSFTGTPAASADYRSTTTPDQRTMTAYSPSVNQPFFIGDGSTGVDAYMASITGTIQTFNIPTGATQLLLGIGADINLADNGGAGYQAQVFDNSPLSGGTVPEPGTFALLGVALASVCAVRRRLA